MPQYSGVWTLQQQGQALTSQQWVTDPNFKQTTLLLQADNAANTAQNNTFLDSSSNAFAITRNGNTTQGSFTPFSQAATAWSNYLPTTSDYFQFNGTQAIGAFSTNAYSIEFWVYSTLTNSGEYLYGGTGEVDLNISTAGTVSLAARGSAAFITATSALTANTWNHVVLARQTTGTNDTRIFVNGVLKAVGTDSTNWANAGVLYLGYSAGPTYLSNVRIVKGSVPTGYQTSSTTTGAIIFTPSTSPLTTSSQGCTAANVALLMCQSNYFVDNSSSPKTITVTGSPSVQAFSPFAPQYQWTSSVIGGSGYFDGSASTYLTAPDNLVFEFGTGDFVLEGWFYPTTSGTVRVLSSHFSGSSGWSMELTTGDLLTFWSGNGTTTGYKVTSTAKVITNQWNYCAVSRSGTSLNTFVNGVSGTAVTDSTNIADNTAAVGVAATPTGTSLYTGYSCDIRIRKGSAITSSTVPTSPLTNITNTSLLLNFANAGIYDGTMKNDLQTVGNAQVSTSVVKYGSGSMYFDGTGDYLQIPYSPNIDLSSGDFTIEGWIYLVALPSVTSGVITFYNGNAVSQSNGQYLIRVNTSNLVFEAGISTTTYSITFSGIATGNWYHFAMVRSGNILSGYLNGVKNSTTQTLTGSLNTSTAWYTQVGRYTSGGTNYELNGYIDDLRVTKGVARYLQNFTPPQVALPRQ